MPLLFPAAALFNSFSMTALLMAIGLTGDATLAAEIGIVQAATLALFFAFSANARGLILADHQGHVAPNLLRNRLLLLLPLGAVAAFLSVGIGGTPTMLAAVLIFRRMAEWIGEICLAEHERQHQTTPALTTLVAEGATLLGCVGFHLLGGVDLAWSAVPWAITPLLALRQAKLFGNPASGRGLSAKTLLPHFGSTAIVGASVYVFRISIALLVGKASAGMLFTAFAIGGLLPTIYGQALAPSLARRFAGDGLPKRYLLIPAAMLVTGLALAWLAKTQPRLPLTSDGSNFFWLAVGLSVAGGAIMTVAASIRARLIHSGKGHDVFGPDLLANALIATCVPFVFHVMGTQALTALYLLSALLSLGFLLGTARQVPGLTRVRGALHWLVAAFLVTPFFFQIQGGLFHDRAFIFDSGGSILHLPLPLSIAGMFGGIALLGHYTGASRSLATLFFTALSFVLTALIVANIGSPEQGAKLVLLAQYLLPMFALVLGEMFGRMDDRRVFERTALWMLVLLVPVHLLLTWKQGLLILAPSLGFFSIYQHLQYFPSVVVGLTLLSCGLLDARSPRWARTALLVLLPAVAVYAVASRSASAMGSLLLGGAVIALVRAMTGHKIKALLAAMIVAIAMGGIYANLSWHDLSAKFVMQDASGGSGGSGNAGTLTQADIDRMMGAPAGVTDRLRHWAYYAEGITSSTRAFLFGHASPPNRDEHPSAHNYWLDALYNFGFLAVAPLLVLLYWTVHALWRQRRTVLSDPLLIATALATFYLMLGENMLKVGMRQPYPGILTFFLWGLLLARLSTTTPTRATAPDQLP
ncbi:MAG: hypothetical protein GTN84_02285 [Hydrogenophaga sp.]|uniref:hypothetical protein n=1 Tax=Hydrogenophaga sp. TaxID=1904254 RepID=UPI0016B7784B|nr:hypothetical protein [Hydrogenophaga sp.]NIM39982.1 hypothetical protein [Hydrogenophaga sp.]NIN25178.1 hypothetical protein [Hydrogenophaga sp.]NIN29745.1 hypothetical protein [Hydrogenophaga sp.]NIN54217.1 hypothetical protein [Hydrogenophaga sp.]NIO50630.1 hypothetical protein [Hydrogenophaga sp.]